MPFFFLKSLHYNLLRIKIIISIHWHPLCSSLLTTVDKGRSWSIDPLDRPVRNVPPFPFAGGRNHVEAHDHWEADGPLLARDGSVPARNGPPVGPARSGGRPRPGGGVPAGQRLGGRRPRLRRGGAAGAEAGR